jgi:hypothetical protein
MRGGRNGPGQEQAEASDEASGYALFVNDNRSQSGRFFRRAFPVMLWFRFVQYNLEYAPPGMFRSKSKKALVN